MSDLEESIPTGDSEAGAQRVGRVILVGAGPGDPDLITLRGVEALRHAEVILYDELAASELLDLAPLDAQCINVGKRGHEPPTRGQEGINELLVAYALAGKRVVRLKGGDPFVFGRGGEEASACVEAGVPFEVVPGISSSVAGPCYAGIPVTDRRYAGSFAVVTGHNDPSTPESRAPRWAELARAVDTLVVLMGVRKLRALVDQLIVGGLASDTPAAAIHAATTSRQRVVECTLHELPQRVEEEGISAPTTVVIGEVVRLRKTLEWTRSAPLFGKRVLLTRTPDQAREMARAVRSAGGQPLLVPMIEIGPAEDLTALDAGLGRVERFDAIVFTSANAVRFFAERARELGCEEKFRRLPGQVLCVGSTSARAALDTGLPVHLVAPGASDAEALLSEILARGPVGGKRFFLPQSDIARTLLAEGLLEEGAEVDIAVAYRTFRPEVDAQGLCKQLAHDELDVLTFCSPSAVRNFYGLLDAPARQGAERCVVAAVGRATAAALRQEGVQPDLVPLRPGGRELIAALVEHLESGPTSGAGTEPKRGGEA